ncbi:WD repeat-containing protein 81 [Coccinella septempunctata]|uniref:WD repeat-containing protein 81 n=1 Tax=Coccinella septempunctata TaxID=41139 RepID=UPI001D0873D9|nr:WD repeat-containing protein 81 [Coccinella septempunctata]
MDSLVEELGIPRKYLKNTIRNDILTACVHKSWLKSLVKYSKLIEFIEKCNKQDIWSSNEDSNIFWEHILVQVFKKWDAKVLPLPRIRKIDNPNSPLFLIQLLQYISQTNYRNLSKSAKKKHLVEDKTSKEKQITLVQYNEALKNIICRIYGCPIVNICDTTLNIDASDEFEVHLNVLPSVCCIETLNSIFLIHIPHIEFTLNDCINFSPAILEKCFTKPLFIIYQLLQVLKGLHDRSLTVGNISLNDIYITEDLWIYVIPDITSNLHVHNSDNDLFKEDSQYDCLKNGHIFNHHLKCESCGICTYDRVQVSDENLEKLCQLWIDGDISNFTYITALNNLSGRRIGDPNCHHVFPWVTDFASRCGKNWRDLKKSKYRLNKGDQQLDLTFEGSQTQVCHHVSDVLSAITYYVYTARRTPKSVLCKNVRTNWVPAEYPSSIQRMQKWTPDECIPEFFTDPSIFRSIHDDLDDLEVPTWCTGPEDFIQKHREALESPHVSERLHHWIDLTFGFKLSGNAAIKAKNVCLHLADEHTNLTKSGIVQLFNHPHPPRHSIAQLLSNFPSRSSIQKIPRQRNRDRSHSSVGAETPVKLEDDETTEDLPSVVNNRPSLGFTRYLSQSRTSLNEEIDHKSSKSPSRSSSVGPKTTSFTSHVSSKSKLQSNVVKNDSIVLPKDYRPELALDLLEKRHNFFSRTFHPELSKRIIPPQDTEENPSIMISNDSTVQNSFTNFIFSEPFQMNSKLSPNRINMFPVDRNNKYPCIGKQRLDTKKNENSVFCNYVEIISKCRVKELQVLGCLIIEIFLPKRMQALSINRRKIKFNDRLKASVSVLKSCESEIPLCVKYIANLLLQPETEDFRNFSYPVITKFGLPSPNAHLLLEPLVNFNIPFSKHFSMLYKLLSMLKNLDNISKEMNVLYHFDCDGTTCSNYENLERTKILFVQNIAECKVKACVKLITVIFEELNTTTDVEVVNILLPYVKQLIEDPPTSVLAAWYLFDPMSRVMGPQKTTKTLLESVLKLYENEPSESTIPYHGRIAKLYHHSFLLRLMVRLGLKCFLDNFVAPIVEAIGGYKDYEKVDFILHSHHEKILKKTSHLKNMDAEVCESSPSDDSSFSSASKPSMSCQSLKPSQEPEIFEFEEDKPSEKQLKSLMEHLELNVSSDLPFNHSAAEEALDAALSENIEHLRSLEELNINISKDYDEKLLMSPTIPIPTCKSTEFNNISCEIGSKKSENELYDKQSMEAENMSDHLESPDVKSSCLSSASGSTKNNKRETKISDMSSDSLLWLSHRLGPVLTARYLSRNLLKMLTLCYVSKENLIATSDYDPQNDIISVTSSYVVGDLNAVKVLDCLGNIAGLYGEQFILFQYIPHMSELIALCKKKITPNFEGGLISCLALLKHVIPYISDSTLMDQLQDNILKNVIHPTVRLLGSTKYIFPSGYIARAVLAKKYLDAMYVLSIRIGADMTRTHLAVPALQRFFLIFDKVHTNENYNNYEEQKVITSSQDQDSIIELNKDGSAREWNISGIRPIQITHVLNSQSTESMSPPVGESPKASAPADAALEELQLVFTAELAHTAYVPFLKHLGLASIEISLKNHDTIKFLCKEYGNEAERTLSKEITTVKTADTSKTSNITHSSSIGSNVAVIGNRIEVQYDSDATPNTDLLNLVSNKIENNNRHLRGNWLAYWGHEIGRSEKDVMFSFKQIKLQSFNGHNNSVKCLYSLDNENSFMSGSRDKTVKLWSLRSQGDGSSVSNCQWTYTAHKKSVLAITFIESMRLVASCDSVIHIWDPFMGVNVGLLESPKYAPVNTLKSMPAPSCLVYAATTDGTLKVIDTRLCSYIYELKVNLNPPGLIRCLAVSPTGLWIAAGQSSGYIAVLDTRTGLIMSSWRAHEGEVLQLVTVDNNTLISSSLDQNISVWNVPDGKFKFHMRGSTEPVHCLNIYNTELISGSTANRIGVHTSIDVDASFSSTKLRSDAFKGLLTSMVLLPLNRLLLLGADTGSISLLC